VSYTYPVNLTGFLVSDLGLQDLEKKLVFCFCSLICDGICDGSAAVFLVLYEET